MKRNLLLMLMLVSCSLYAMAQSDFYYSKGKKIPLTINENKVCVSISKDADEIIKRIRANVKIQTTIKDETFAIFVIQRSEFKKLSSLDSWKEDAKSVMVSSCYFTEENREVCASPYFDVFLKAESDKGLLTSYVEKYKLRVVYNSRFLPLWYTLAVTLDTGKSSLDCANELYESGKFSSSVPDLCELDNKDISNAVLVVEGRVWNMVSLSPAETPEPGTEQDYYKDLKGRWCKGSPFKLVLEGDTAMTGKNYKKMMMIRGDENRFICGLRQDGNRVYGCYQDGDSEELFLDFSLDEEDIFTSTNDDLLKMRVDRADYVVVNGFERKLLWMWNYEEGVDIVDGLVNVWIEGVGGVIGGPAFPFQWNVIGNQSMMLSCYQGNSLLYSYDGNNTNSIEMSKITSNSSSAIFDLQGRRLPTGTLPKGIYIREGKKFVVK